MVIKVTDECGCYLFIIYFCEDYDYDDKKSLREKIEFQETSLLFDYKLESSEACAMKQVG